MVLVTVCVSVPLSPTAVTVTVPADTSDNVVVPGLQTNELLPYLQLIDACVPVPPLLLVVIRNAPAL